jgi:hypothetical protein
VKTIGEKISAGLHIVNVCRDAGLFDFRILCLRIFWMARVSRSWKSIGGGRGRIPEMEITKKKNPEARL